MVVAGGSAHMWLYEKLRNPAYSCGAHGSEMRVWDTVQPLLAAHGVDIAFAGVGRRRLHGALTVASGLMYVLLLTDENESLRSRFWLIAAVWLVGRVAAVLAGVGSSSALPDGSAPKCAGRSTGGFGPWFAAFCRDTMVEGRRWT